MNVIFCMYEQSESSYAKTLFAPLYYELAREGHRVYFYRLTNAKNTEDIVPPSIQNNSSFTLTNVNIYGNFFNKVASAVKLCQQIKKLYEGNNDTRVIVRSVIPFLFLLPLLPGRKFRKSMIYDGDGIASLEAYEFRSQTLLRKIRNLSLLAIECFAVRASSAIISRSSATKFFYRRCVRLNSATSHLELDNCFQHNLTFFAESDLEDVEIPSRSKLGIDSNSIVFCLQGSIGPQYMIAETFKILTKLSESGLNVHLLWVSRQASLDQILAQFGKPKFPISIKNATPIEVPRYLVLADFGISIRANSRSMNHVKPLKTRDFLSCGVPIIYTCNTGDRQRFPMEIAFPVNFEHFEMERLKLWIQNTVANRQTVTSSCRRYYKDFFLLKEDVKRLNEFIVL